MASLAVTFTCHRHVTSFALFWSAELSRITFITLEVSQTFYDLPSIVHES